MIISLIDGGPVSPRSVLHITFTMMLWGGTDVPIIDTDDEILGSFFGGVSKHPSKIRASCGRSLPMES